MPHPAPSTHRNCIKEDHAAVDTRLALRQ